MFGTHDFLNSVLNTKVALFFLAFVPWFYRRRRTVQNAGVSRAGPYSQFQRYAEESFCCLDGGAREHWPRNEPFHGTAEA
jgi:hypothetical protein